MNRRKIPWCDYTINPVKGLCPMACPYCYARRMYKRFKWNPEIRFEPEVFDGLVFQGAPLNDSKIFVGSTIELFGEWVKDEWLDEIFHVCRCLDNLTFIFLTKKPENLIKWSPFPENCWVGVTGTNETIVAAACAWLSQIQVRVRFISIEPLLSWNSPNAHNSRFHWQERYHDVNWLIIGSQTQPVRHPKREWVDEILQAADRAKIPVFVKEPLASHYQINRREWPR